MVNTQAPWTIRETGSSPGLVIACIIYNLIS